jgi:integrase
MRAGLAEHNPVIGTVKGEERPRDRVLSQDELKLIWAAADDGTNHSAIVRLLMLTAGRKSEVGGMAWAELDRERALWVIPAARYKTRREHEVPLSRQALAIIGEFPELPGHPFLFGRGGRVAFSGWSRCKERLDRRIAERQGAPSAEWNVHDLRRSAVTHMAELGLAEPHVIEAVVGHARGGVEAVYNRARHRAAKATALQRWADWLVSGTAPGNVIALAG